MRVEGLGLRVRHQACECVGGVLGFGGLGLVGLTETRSPGPLTFKAALAMVALLRIWPENVGSWNGMNKSWNRNTPNMLNLNSFARTNICVDICAKSRTGRDKETIANRYHPPHSSGGSV